VFFGSLTESRNDFAFRNFVIQLSFFFSHVCYQEKRASEKCSDSGNSRESVPPDPPVAVAVAAEGSSKKEEQAPKKRKGEAEKLLADQKGRTTRRATAKEKVPFSSCIEIHSVVV